MQTIFSPMGGIALILGFTFVLYAIVWPFIRTTVFSKPNFLVADRKIGPLLASVSIAASWTWAPSLFIAAQMSYTSGWVGLFWFVVPNVACLVIFAFFAERIRHLLPDGFTLSDYMRERHSPRVQFLYLCTLTGLNVCAFAVQLVGGGALIAGISGLSYPWVTVALALIPVGYSLRAGIRASFISDAVQMCLILGVVALLVPWTVAEGGGWAAVSQGLWGKTGTYSSLFSGDGLLTTLAFGIPTTIGLLSGPFGDQSFYERAFSVRKECVLRIFVCGALIFAITPLSLSLLGFIAAGNGLAVSNVQNTNLTAIAHWLPLWTVIPFTAMILAGLVSNLDSKLASIASLAGHDLINRQLGGMTHNETHMRMFAQGAMVLLVFLGIMIANIPGITVLYLFLFYGTLRAATLLPTVITLIRHHAFLSEKGMFYGILASLCIGLPLFSYAGANGLTDLKIAGSLSSVGASGCIVLITGLLRIR